MKRSIHVHSRRLWRMFNSLPEPHTVRVAGRAPTFAQLYCLEAFHQMIHIILPNCVRERHSSIVLIESSALEKTQSDDAVVLVTLISIPKLYKGERRHRMDIYALPGQSGQPGQQNACCLLGRWADRRNGADDPTYGPSCRTTGSSSWSMPGIRRKPVLILGCG